MDAPDACTHWYDELSAIAVRPLAALEQASMHRRKLFRGTADYSYEQRASDKQASSLPHTLPHGTSNPIGESCSRYHTIWLRGLVAFHTGRQASPPQDHTSMYTLKPSYQTILHLESHLCRRQVRVQYPNGEAEGRDRRPASAEAKREARPLEPPRDALRGHHNETRWGKTTRQAREPLQY